ncbi:hypothetical protein GJ629_03770 [Halapricum sp. CBA1109]|uniref:hypothetical protein n=1 Tax=Halapricum sp. CBA1109 TaxID=2668068 RepID=UPI0012F7424E|nr:hypothetical protein [Halapricum sp. CBA1109]MUV89127.1 hypothetical protein [Halapricum sp. CBA1109]
MDDPRARVARAVSGMVAGGYAVDFDLGNGSVPCDQCDRSLGNGDEVTAALSCYEGHTWELYGLYCAAHGVETIGASMGAGSDEQAVVAATLEPTGYHDPRGDHHPEAVSLGGVDVLDYAPMAYD